MIKAVLLDLDNTAIQNPDHTFAKAFLGSLSLHFEQKHGYESIPELFHGFFPRLQSRNDPRLFNYSFMLEQIANEISEPIDVVRNSLDEYYSESYPQLRGLIQPVPAGSHLIQKLHAMGITIIIATNPIYPEQAVTQRMLWGELPTGDYYSFITHAENMHYIKPSPQYYAELLGRIGLEPDEVLLVGDSIKNDLVPARTLGIRTFHITSEKSSPAEYFGSLDYFCHLVSSNDSWLSDVEPVNLQPEMIEIQYHGNMAALYGLLALVQEHQWNQHPIEGEWSILQILSHLYLSEPTIQRQRLIHILTKENPFLSPESAPGPDIPVCNDNGYWIAEQFVNERENTITFLNSLCENDWNRPARHSVFGLTTLLEMAHFTAQHDRLHLNQLCQTISLCT